MHVNIGVATGFLRAGRQHRGLDFAGPVESVERCTRCLATNKQHRLHDWVLAAPCDADPAAAAVLATASWQLRSSPATWKAHASPAVTSIWYSTPLKMAQRCRRGGLFASRAGGAGTGVGRGWAVSCAPGVRPGL